jgi:hypothetical protein
MFSSYPTLSVSSSSLAEVGGLKRKKTKNLEITEKGER